MSMKLYDSEESSFEKALNTGWDIRTSEKQTSIFKKEAYDARKYIDLFHCDFLEHVIVSDKLKHWDRHKVLILLALFLEHDAAHHTPSLAGSNPR